MVVAAGRAVQQREIQAAVRVVDRLRQRIVVVCGDVGTGQVDAEAAVAEQGDAVHRVALAVDDANPGTGVEVYRAVGHGIVVGGVLEHDAAGVALAGIAQRQQRADRVVAQGIVVGLAVGHVDAVAAVVRNEVVQDLVVGPGQGHPGAAVAAIDEQARVDAVADADEVVEDAVVVSGGE